MHDTSLDSRIRIAVNIRLIGRKVVNVKRGGGSEPLYSPGFAGSTQATCWFHCMKLYGGHCCLMPTHEAI